MLPAMTIIPLVSRMTFPVSRRPGPGGLMDLFRVMISMCPTAEPPPSHAAGPRKPASLITVTRNGEALNARRGTPFPLMAFARSGRQLSLLPGYAARLPGVTLVSLLAAEKLGLAAAGGPWLMEPGIRGRDREQGDHEACRFRSTPRHRGPGSAADQPADVTAHHPARHRGRRSGGQPAVRAAAAAVRGGPAQRHQPLHQLAGRLRERGPGHLRHDAADPQRRQHA